MSNIKSFILLIPLVLLTACGESRNERLAKAASLIKHGNIDQAYSIYHSLYQDDPFDVKVIRHLMQTSKERGNPDAYLSWAYELLKYHPWDREANILVSQHLANQKEWKDAILRLLLASQDSVYKKEKRDIVMNINRLNLWILSDIENMR